MEGQAGERRSRVAPAGVKEKDAKNDNAGSRKGLALSFGEAACKIREALASPGSPVPAQ